MAKRKRLTPPQETYLAAARTEARALPGPFATPAPPAPIAQIAGDAATTAALQELSDEMSRARAEGRLVQRLPLAAIEVDHLVRDRVASDPEEMATLSESLRQRGQQSPIDVVDLGQGRYGLISGWRRLTALQQLFEETGDPRFSAVQALLRRPEGASGAYLAMVEENEIRVGLNHYERARIALKATEQGVYASPQEALRHLFASASRAKRSKIGSFITLHHALGAALRFPGAIPERLGLALAGAIEADAGLAPRLREVLQKATPGTSAEEQRLLDRALGRALGRSKTVSDMAEMLDLAPDLQLQFSGPKGRMRLVLSGPRVDAALIERLALWLQDNS